MRSRLRTGLANDPTLGAGLGRKGDAGIGKVRLKWLSYLEELPRVDQRVSSWWAQPNLKGSGK